MPQEEEEKVRHTFPFKKKNRIKKKKDFEFLYKNGRRRSFSCYSVVYHPSGEKRLAIAVPKRFGNAVFRNRQKRIIREHFRLNSLFWEKPLDVIFIMIRKPEDISKQKKELEGIFRWLTNTGKSSGS